MAKAQTAAENRTDEIECQASEPAIQILMAEELAAVVWPGTGLESVQLRLKLELREVSAAFTPDDPLPDLDRRLAELHAMGPMEFDPDERRIVEDELDELNTQSKDAIILLTADRDFQSVKGLKIENWF